jgi:hypothetical protein
MPEGLPRATGAVVFPEATGDEVKILLLVGATFGEGTGEGCVVVGKFGLVGDGFGGGAQQGEGCGREGGAEAVVSAFAIAAVGDEFGGAKESELGGDARLGHAENLLEFGYGEFFPEEQGKDAESSGLGEEAKGVPRSVHGVVWRGLWTIWAGDERVEFYPCPSILDNERALNK